MPQEQIADDAAAKLWAQDVLAGDFVVLDTETTGLGIWDQIVQIGIIDGTGRVLLDTLVHPTRPIDPQATAIHHITDIDVDDAPYFAELRPHIVQAIQGKRVIIYNASFDLDMLIQSDGLFQCDVDDAHMPLGPAWKALANYECAMRKYSAFVGDWSDYHGDYRFQKLPGGDHSAIGDARATLRLIARMAGLLNSEVVVPVMDAELDAFERYHGTPLADVLSAFAADLSYAFSERAQYGPRTRLAQDWLDAWKNSREGGA